MKIIKQIIIYVLITNVIKLLVRVSDMFSDRNISSMSETNQIGGRGYTSKKSLNVEYVMYNFAK